MKLRQVKTSYCTNAGKYAYFYGTMLTIGNYYWIRKTYQKDKFEKVRFLQITPKGYGFLRSDLRRYFKKPIYPIHKITNGTFFFDIKQNVTLYTSVPDGTPETT